MTERNPFGPTASLLLRVAFRRPGKPWGIRELAQMAGVSPALASLVLRRLERLGHVSRESTGEARFLDLPRLLEDWAAWYAAAPIESYRYSMEGAETPKKMLARLSKARAQLPGRWALSAMAGASLAAPHAVFNEAHVHLAEADQLQSAWRRSLLLTPDTRGPFHILRPYYAEAGLLDMREIRKLPVVSDIQLYLECRRYPVRGREQAEHLLHKIAREGTRDAKKA